jgi:hypothetical protein
VHAPRRQQCYCCLLNAYDARCHHQWPHELLLRHLLLTPC